MRFKAVTVLALALTPVLARAAKPLMDYASPVRDITLKSNIVKRDMDLLKTISTEFAQSYRVAASELWYKEPNKLLLISKAGLMDVVYKINGNAKTVKAGFLNKRWDVTHAPGQRQTALTVGLMTPAWVDLVNATYYGAAKVDGRPAVIYDARFKESDPRTWYRLYIDSERKIVLKQEQRIRDGSLKVTLHYMDPVRRNGVWAPTQIEVVTPDGKQGALTKMDGIRINTGLSDDLFKL
ncbi:MAG TPA: outer membrane lipoprotein-sorting protein [Armatimonadota bacterium]